MCALGLFFRVTALSVNAPHFAIHICSFSSYCGSKHSVPHLPCPNGRTEPRTTIGKVHHNWKIKKLKLKKINAKFKARIPQLDQGRVAAFHSKCCLTKNCLRVTEFCLNTKVLKYSNRSKSSEIQKDHQGSNISL